MINCEDFNYRLEIARGLSSGKRNCIGTALFLSGARSCESYLDPIDDFYNAISGLIPIREPKIGEIISWEGIYRGKPRIFHMGLIMIIGPILITHRPGFDCPINMRELHENEPLEIVLEGYKGKIKYYEVLGN